MKIKNECSFQSDSVVRNVERSLAWINPMDLVGISFIRLMDDLPKPNDRSPHWHKELKKRYEYLNGLYVGKLGNEPSHINLYIPNIYRGIPYLLALTPFPALLITDNLAHEVGHHLIYTRGYVFQPTEVFKHQETIEEFCDRYAFGVTTKMTMKWRYRLSRWVLRRLAGWHLAMGALNEGMKKQKKASEHYRAAFNLDNRRDDALYFYKSITPVGNAEQIVEPERRERLSHQA